MAPADDEKRESATPLRADALTDAQREAALSVESTPVQPLERPGQRDVPRNLQDLWRRVNWLFVFNVIAAIAASAQAYFACRGNELTREVAIGSQRAWLTVKTARFPIGFKPQEIVLVELRLLNAGQSPAVRVRTVEADSGFSSPCNGKHEHARLPADTPVSDSVIAPGADYGQALNGPRVTADDITAIRGEKKRLYFWGSIQYQDAFTRSHVTRYCMQYEEGYAKISDGDRNQAAPFGWCGCHNEAD